MRAHFIANTRPSVSATAPLMKPPINIPTKMPVEIIVMPAASSVARYACTGDTVSWFLSHARAVSVRGCARAAYRKHKSSLHHLD